MNVHTAASYISDHIKPMVASAEAFRVAISDHREKKEAHAWIGRDKNPKNRRAIQDPATRASEAKKNNQEISHYAGAYAKAPPNRGPKMATIQWKETKKRRTDPQ